MQIKAVINVKHGGFGVSKKAVLRLRELGHKDALKEEIRDDNYNSYLWDTCRIDPLLVQVVEELGEEAYGAHAELEIVEGDIGIELDNYDGYESNPRITGWLC